jgi:site-specific DNA-methyltransferase (adenine-specific)
MELQTFTDFQKSEYSRLKAQAKQGWLLFAEAIVKIRDGNLYGIEYRTFKEFCQNELGFTDSYALKLMNSAEVVSNLINSDHGPSLLPQSERQARPLTKLEPELQIEAWAEVIEETPQDKITAKVIAEKVEEKKELNETLKKVKEENQVTVFVPHPLSEKEILAKAKEIQDKIKEEKRQEIINKVAESRVVANISENIKQGDCLQILESLADGCIDIVLTDPPYGISYKSNRSIYDDSITKRGLMNDSKKDAFDLLDKVCEVLLRKTAENSHLYFFCSWAVFSSFEQIISKYFTIKTPIVWDKGNKGSGDLENDWGNQTEIAIYCVKGKKLINTRRGNIISVPRLHSSIMVHPTQKPIQLLKEILSVSYKQGDFIVDPFMGSGSTIKACQEMDAACLGIELDDEIFKIANNFIYGN